jgi:gliding motility-associated-like protein
MDNSSNILGGASAPAGPGDPSSLGFTDIVQTNPSCFGFCNGSKTRFWIGASPLTVTLVTVAGTTVYAPVGAFTSQTYNGLCAGTHTFLITDGNGCVFTRTFSVTQPATLTATTATAQPSCNGGSDGSFSVTPSGGTPNYTVNFSNSTSAVITGTGTAVATGLSFGPVTATITDSRGCVSTVSNTIGQPTTLTITSTQTNVTCGGACTGAASVSIAGGGGTYSVSWSPGPGTASLITGLCAGTHTATITDNNGCVRDHTLFITQPTSITITPTITNLTCNGSILCNGAASVTGTGPGGVISFTWVAPGPTVIATTSAITNVCAGIYTVLSSSSIDPTCTISQTIDIAQPPNVSVTVLTQSANCIDFCNGSATATPTGGNGGPFTYTWTTTTSTVVQNTQVAVNLCAGSHTVSVRDASLCPASTVITIVEPPSFNANITTTSLNCNGVCNGVITSSPTGGAGTYTFVLSSPTSTITSSTGSFTGLCGGTYVLNISDSNSPCGQNFTVTLLQPNPLVPSVSVTPITCANVCNGAIAGSASGGTPGYTLSWSTPTSVVPGGAITGLCTGSYTFNVTDALGCTTAATVVNLTAPAPINVTITPTNINCSSNCNGILSASVTGGTPGYTLFWQNNGFTGNPNTGLCANIIYTLTVTDASGCVQSSTATVTSPPAISVSQTISPTNCAGSADGTATFVATGGVSPYSYQFNTSPVVTNTTGIITGLSSGNYIVTITDANSCPFPVTFTITSPLALSAAITGIKGSCSSCTGGSTVTPSNGTAPYTFAWTNTLNVNISTLSTPSLMCAGNYTATVTDSKSCTATATVNIPQIVILTAITGGTGIQCFGACTGSAVASPSGGQTPYTFSWSTPTAQTTQTATNLCAGNYTVTVTDSNVPACVSTATVSVAQPPDIVLTGTQVNVTCFNTCNGSINITASGGTGALTYSWSPGGQTTQNLTGICTGTYAVTVRDANSCSKTLTFNIAPPFPPITGTLNPTNPTNCGTPNNGSICVSAGGGNGTYTYSWSTAATSTCITGLVAGSYSVIVTSAGCSNTFATLLSTPAGPSLTLVSSQSVTCFGGTNGAATFSASGLGPFTFTWSPTTSTISSISGVPSGTYFLASTDIGNNCITTRSVVITQPASLTLITSIGNVRCSNTSCDGSITITPSGGNPAYTYTLSSGFTATGLTASTNTLCQGNYTLTVSDANSCPAATFTFAITTPPAITITNTLSNVLCNAACNGSIVANATGGTGAISYSWVPVGAFSGSTTATVLNLCPNVYTLIASDVNSCSATSSFTITEPPVLTVTVSPINETCFNVCNGSASIVGGGGTPTYSFSWSSSTVTASTYTGLCAGNYTGTVIDANGCTAAQGFTLTSPIPVTASLTPTHPKCNAACNGSIATVITGAQGAVSYSWSPAGTGANPTNLCAATYTLIATDANSCQALAVITLTNPPIILANVTSTNPSCNGGCNGIAVASPINAIGAVQYTWLPSGPNSPTNTALCSGIFTVSLQDANLCEVTQTFALTDPPAIGINPSIGPATCGSPNGSITALPVGGTPGYTFGWSSPTGTISTTGSVITGIFAGIYTVIVTDSKNCSDTVIIPLSNSNGPTAPISSTNNICNGDCNGIALVGPITSAVNTLAPVWFFPAPSTTINPITNLCAGNYSVQLEDSNGCLTFTGTTITEPPPIFIQPNIALPTCNGICNGSITISTTGGISPYTFSWTPGTSTSSVLTNACSGTYSVIIGYNSGLCVSTQTVNIPSQFSITIAPPTVLPNNCFGDCTGAATINVISTTNGSPTATLNWSNGQFGNTATNLCNGNYSVTVTDSQGCNNTFSVPITSPPQLSVTSAVVQPSCNACNGEATVTAGGGAGSGYSFNWSTGSTSPTLTGLCAGLYQVLITDASNCTQTQNVVINNSNGITGDSIVVTNETCFGMCNGSATVNAIGGNAPISYSWINPVISAASTTAGNLCEGDYFIQMTDQQGCIRTASLSIIAATDLTLSPFVVPPSCSPGGDGSISVLVAGGSPSYSYAWTPAASNSSVITNLAPGNYSLTVTDQNGTGCSKTQVFNLSTLTGPTITSVVDNVSCAPACNGAISITVTGTSPVINWSVPGSGTATTVSGLCRGLVTLTVTDNGCTSVRSFSISEDPELELISNVLPVKCNDGCNGAITMLPIGGTLPYTFSWTPGASTANQLQSLCSGTYIAMVTDVRGCSRDTSIVLINPAAISTTINTNNSSCTTVNDGSISVQLLGGVAPYTFTWTGPFNFTSASQNINNVFAGSYTLSFSDSTGCSQDSVLTLSTTVGITANAGRDTLVCPGSSVVLSGVNSQGASAFRWYLLPDSVLSVASTPTILLSDARDTYTYQLIAVSSSTACVDKDTVVVTAFTEPYLDAGPSYTIPVFSTVTIGGNPTSTGISTVTWTPSLYLDDALSQNPIASNTIDVTYTVSITYGNGCIVSDTMKVLIYPEIQITNGFSPNNDNRNDKWIIDYIDQFPDNVVEIYNRWGELLYRSIGYKEPFDGTYKGKNLPVGTYYYIIHLNHPAYLKPYTGPLTIFR